MNTRIETTVHCIALAAFVACITAATAGDFPERGICGHGCDLGACPEDSVVGLRSAIAKGAHMVEFDVQRCKTGELVVIHDGDLARKTTVTGSVARSTFDYIRSARLKSRKYPNEKVPTLDEMLDALPREGILVNVHCYGDELVGRDAALKIKEKGRIDQAYIACVLPMIKKAREAVPEIRVCNMTRPDPKPPRPWTDSECRDYIKASAENNCQYIQLRYRCTKEIADEAHKAGLKINYCPRNCEGRFPERLEEILAFGADYVFCENLTPVLRRWRELTGEPAKGSPLDELMPAPRLVEKREGTLDAAAAVWPKAKVASGVVQGAPKSVADEAYILEVTPSGVAVTASAKPGLRNARTTLEQLAKLSMGAPLPCCRIVDWPELRWRGFMLDTGRNYLDVPSLKDLIDVMAEYKLNLYHWHITEYYGWRLESKRYPQVAERGYYDPLGHRHRGKFYTQEEFKEIVDYAFERGVTVMPEFDVPGHAEAFRNAFGFKSMKDPAVKETLCNLIDELCSLVPAEKMPFVHLGGDEVWDEKEKIEEESMTAWAATVAKNGRTLVTWDPGQSFKPSGPRVAMLWGGTLDKEAPWFDARGWYIEDYDPFEVLGAAAYRPPFQGKKGEPQQLGAIFCGWHDSAVGLPYEKTFREQPVFPSCVLFGDLYWRGRDEYHKEFVRRRLPLAGDPLLGLPRDLERRAVAQRDKVLLGLRHPFHFVRQTQMRWRMTELDGTVVAKDIAQGAVFVYDGKKSSCNIYHSPTGTVVVETWVKSPNDRTIGAWIGFSAYDRDHGRSRSWGTPDLGKWNKFGATISVNGEQIPPPVWQQPSMRPGKTLAEVGHVHEIDETPYTNDEWYMREPTPVRLKKGWNHVRMVLPMTRAVDTWRTHRWVGIFMPVDGTTDHPHEIDDLEYSSDPPDEAGCSVTARCGAKLW